MAKTKDVKTEVKIIAAAKKIFMQHGMTGARMQQIADEAGINKALLHYYFRSKDRLFFIVFKEALKELIPNLLRAFESEGDVFDRIKRFIYAYLELLDINPYIPGFVLHELNHRPGELTAMLYEINPDITTVIEDVQREIDNGTIRAESATHLFINIISLCVFPIVAKPMVTGFLLKEKDIAYEQFIEQRKSAVVNFVINSIKPVS